MPARKTPRLAYCEYVIPDPNGSTLVWMARLDLMRAVQRVFPTMLQRLSSDVFPAYKALAESGFDLDAILWNHRCSPFTELGAVDLALIELQARIRAAEPAPSEASSKLIPSNNQIAQAVRDGDFSTYSRLVNERDAAAFRRRRQLVPKIEPKTVLRNCAALRDALQAWGVKFNAGVLWFLDETLRTLRGWYVAPEWRDALKWNPIGGVSSTLAMGERFQFDCEGWEMQTFTWAYYSRSVRERFEQKLTEYEVASRKLAESRGLVRAPRKYSPSNFDWFVLYQFEGLSSTEIADRCSQENESDIDPSSVLKGVKTAAKLVGWDRLRAPHAKRNRKIR